MMPVVVFCAAFCLLYLCAAIAFVRQRRAGLAIISIVAVAVFGLMFYISLVGYLAL